MSNELIDDLRNSLTPSVGFELLMQNESLTKERDTYRDLCVELLKAAQGYVHHMPTSSAKEGGANRHSGMLKASDNLKSAISKAEKLLGENNAT